MAAWRRVISIVGGRRIIGALGVLYVGLSVLRANIGLAGGDPIGNVVIVSFLIGGPGLVLIGGAIWVANREIATELYTDVAGWCLAGFLTMAFILTVFHMQPEGGVSDPLTGPPLLTALSSVAGFGVGIYDGRAKTKALQLEQRAIQQETVAHLGQYALEADDLDELLREVTQMVADALEVELCKVLERDAENDVLLLRQGVGWKDGIVGEATVSATESDSQAAHTLTTARPIIVEDLNTETRFSGPQLLTSHSVQSGISTIIGPTDDPWGILGAHDTSRQAFTPEDINFVQSVANILTETIERETKKQQLEERQTLLEVATKAASVGIWTWNIEENVVTTDRNLAELYEIDPPKSTDGAPVEVFYDPIHPDDREETWEQLERALEETGELTAEYRIVSETGTVKWVEARGEVVYEGGDPVRVHGAVTDVTERKVREQRLEELVTELEASNERLEQFAYAASHDLQEPLRMISSYLQLIERRYDFDADGEEFLAFAIDGADRMRAMINGLLEYSRVDTQGEPFERVDLDCVLEDVCDNLQIAIEERNAVINAESLPCVEGDPNQLRQVFQNILDNALTYSDGQPTVAITATETDSMWTISISDDGTGIEQATQEHIFEVFHRGYSHNEYTGTGLGLALCERIIERHGGEIWVDSEPDAGSTFSFTLPTAEN